ncbi:hypothetical protein FTX61_11030 [Nitriliruptoraceae bacterium ZYF776]|nr:hypothetical protein [Profundirhabdus halotolerans]
MRDARADGRRTTGTARPSSGTVVATSTEGRPVLVLLIVGTVFALVALGVGIFRHLQRPQHGSGDPTTGPTTEGDHQVKGPAPSRGRPAPPPGGVGGPSGPTPPAP